MFSIRILLVDDFPVWRLQLRSILAAHPEWQVVGEASDGLEALQKAEQLSPDLILLDIGLPKLNGIAVEYRLCETVPAAKVIFVTQNDDLDVVEAVFSNRTQGYVLKSDARRELVPAIQTVLRGDRFLSSGVKFDSVLA